MGGPTGAGTREKAPVAWWRGQVRSFLELFALCGIAFAQPMLDILSKNTGLFVTRGTTGSQAVALVLLVLLVPPATCWVVEAALGTPDPRRRPWVHAAIAALLVAVIAEEVAKQQTSLGRTALLIAGGAWGVVGGACVLRFDVVRRFLRFLAVAPLVFGLLFLTASPVSDVVFGSRATAAAKVGITRPNRVVMVVLDELPEMSLLDGAGHVDSQLYPNFAALEGDATWYRNETTVGAFTIRAVPAILTGSYPVRTVYPSAADYPRSLFTLLGRVYRMNVHEPVTRLCPDRICGSATGTGFGSLLRQTVNLWDAFASPHRTEPSFDWEESLTTALRDGRRFAPTIVRATGPRLDFAHIELPHNPWRYLQTLQDVNPWKLPVEWTDRRAALLARPRHLLQVQATDTLLGQIIERLKRAGAYDDSLVVVTADHGVAFTNGEPTRSATIGNYPEIMWPPLFIKYPGQRTGRIDDRPAQSIDILPTIADVIGMKIPWPVDGASLLGPVRPDMPRRMYQGPLPGRRRTTVTPPPGQKYFTFDGRLGFSHVLRAQAAPAGGDPQLRLYRLGRYGSLVGQQAAPLVTGAAGSAIAEIRNLSRFDHVDPSARRVPWFQSYGFVRRLDRSAWIAVALNGTIVAVTPTGLPNRAGTRLFEFLAPPPLVHAGKNEVSVYLVRGTPGVPRLASIRLGSRP